jgi:hypothetical protein
MAGVLSDEIDVLAKARRSMPGDYVPSETETYMNEQQQDYFRRLLLEWKKSILSASSNTLSALQEGPIREPDLNDRASSETDWGIELRTRDRQRKPDRRRRLRILRSDRRTDRPGPAGRTPDCNNDGRGATGARTPRKGFARQLNA